MDLSNHRIKYFPFSPGIPWRLAGENIVPKIDAETWQEALTDKELVIMAYGGLLESVCSFAVVDALSKVEPLKNKYWAGNNIFKTLLHMQRKARWIDIPDLRFKYPVPLFLDAENKAYFNLLNNYLTRYTFKLKHPYPNTRPVFNQIFSNALINWDKNYVPNFNITEKFKKWANNSKFYINNKYILIIPNKTSFSIHNKQCLNWSRNDINALASSLKRFGIKTVVCAENYSVFYNCPIITAPLELEIIIPLLEKTEAILAYDIDWLIISLIISKANIFSLEDGAERCPFDLYKNADFIQAENFIYKSNELTSNEVYSIFGATQ